MKPVITAVDLFCGAGGTSTGLELASRGLGVDLDLIAVNHWETAINTHSKNHPQAEHRCEPIEMLKPREVMNGRHLNILMASPECFPADTLILTECGLVRIQDVKIGDAVLTHKGRLRKVTGTMSKASDTVVVKGHGHYGLETTASHPFYSRIRRRVWDQPRRRWSFVFSDPEWVESESMSGNWWATPNQFDGIRPEVIAQEEWSNPEFFWMVGRWLGDGSNDVRKVRGGCVTICCGKHEADDLAPKLTAAGMGEWKRREVRTATLFDLRSAWLSGALFNEFGHGASGKSIPTWVLTLERPLREALLDGYLSADGHFNGRKQEATTVSKFLAIGIKLLAESLGHRVAVHKTTQHCNTIEGRQVNVQDVYRVMWVKDRKHEYARSIDGHSWGRVKSVEDGRQQVIVYNLSVEDDESYVADGIVVHNCTHHSNARGGKPINDQSRSTALRVTEWVEALLPDWVLVENVQEFQHWGPVDSQGKRIKDRRGEIYTTWLSMFTAIGYNVSYRIINSADYGDPTTRKRLFIMARRGDLPISWPEPTHRDPKQKGSLISVEKPWRTAREIIDWDNPGTSIFNRKKPLAKKTLERIAAGLEKFGGPNAEPFLLILRNNMDGMSIDGPTPTVAAGGQHIGVCSPYLIRYTKGNAVGVDSPLPTQTTQEKLAAIEPILIKYHGGEHSAKRSKSIDSPVETVDCSNRFAVIEPMILPHEKFQLTQCDSIDSPLRTIDATNGRCIRVVESVIVPNFGEREGQQPRSHAVSEPLPTVTGHGAGMVAEPVIVELCHGNGNEDPEKAAKRRATSIDEPVPTVTTAHGKAVATPFILITEEGEFGLDIRLRMLSPRELARAMGFPEWYEFVGSKDAQVRQIGNAVAVGTAQALTGSILKEIIKDLPEEVSEASA